MKIENIDVAISALEKLIGYLKQSAGDIGHADKFFSVGEFDLAFEEIYHGLQQNKFTLTGESAELYTALKSYFNSKEA